MTRRFLIHRISHVSQKKMSLYSWKIFLAVVEHKSFVKAARALNLTPSAVSHMIAKMEEDYGYPLFIRNRNSIKLTANGELLLPHVRNLLQCNDTLSQEILSLKNTNRGLVRIATFNSVAQIWLPSILKEFHKKYPEIKVVVRQSGDLKIKKWIDRGEIDLAINSSNVIRDNSFFPLHKTPLVCMTPKDYSPLNGHSVTAKDLKNVSIILQSEGYDTESVKYLLDNGISVDSDFRIESDDTCRAYVEHGFGFCITTETVALCNDQNVNIYPLEPVSYRTIGLVTVFPKYISPAAKLLRQQILQFISDSDLMNV